jgi:hypothetical protein
MLLLVHIQTPYSLFSFFPIFPYFSLFFPTFPYVFLFFPIFPYVSLFCRTLFQNVHTCIQLSLAFNYDICTHVGIATNFVTFQCSNRLEPTICSVLNLCGTGHELFMCMYVSLPTVALTAWSNANEEIAAMGREIESRQGIGW